MANYDSNYNPNADPALDSAPYKGGEDSVDYEEEVTGADTSLETAAREDRDAAKTDSHDCLSVLEPLLSDVREDERNVSGGTRGRKVDAYKQERVLDRAVRDQEKEEYDA